MASAPQATDSQSPTANSEYVYVTDMVKTSPNASHTESAVTSVSNNPVKLNEGVSSEPPKGPPLIVKVGVASIGISALFYVMLFIYLGVSSNQTAYTQNLNIAVGIFDAGQLGLAFQRFASNIPAGNGLPNLQVFEFPAGRSDGVFNPETKKLMPSLWLRLLPRRQAAMT